MMRIARARQAMTRLRRDRSGLALTEFALTLPILLVFTTSGLELVNYTITVKRIGEIGVMVADNASRMGSQSAYTNIPISEAEINDVFIGADLQGGGLSLSTNGRIVLSSLEKNASGNGQTIKWQRCFGAVPVQSAYGAQDVGKNDNSFLGMGPAANRVTAASNTAVMVVEITYRYKRIMPFFSLPLNDIKEFTAFNVRDNRDLSKVYNDEHVAQSMC